MMAVKSTRTTSACGQLEELLRLPTLDRNGQLSASAVPLLEAGIHPTPITLLAVVIRITMTMMEIIVSLFTAGFTEICKNRGC